MASMAGKAIIERIRSIDIRALNSYRTELLGVIILVLFALFFNSYIYRSKVEQLSSLSLEISNKESEILKLEAKSKAIAGLEKSVTESGEKLKRVKSRLASLKERLPSTSQMLNLLNELSGEGSGEDVRIVSIKPLASENKGDLVRLPFQVNVESGFFSFGDYIERLENLERVMVIENFKIEASAPALSSTGEAKTGRLASQVYLSAYILGAGN